MPHGLTRTIILVIALGAAAARADEASRPIAVPAAPLRPFDQAQGRQAQGRPSEQATQEDRPIAAPTSSLATDGLRTTVALVGVIALALVLKKVLKRLGDPLAARRPSGVVRVLARFPFAKGQQVVLLEVGKRVLCVHQSSGAATALCSFDNLTEIADLKARIEAGSDDRVKFDSELTRSIERSPLNAIRGAQVTETIDLTKDRRRVGIRSILGARA